MRGSSLATHKTLAPARSAGEGGDVDRFTLEGTTYYQQGRKCSKAGCHCMNGGALHGPYWYARNEHGRRRYVGRDLPEHIAGTRAAHDQRLSDMVEERLRLAGEMDAITRLLRNDPLRDGDREIVTALGFGDCLAQS